jgi:hypothetical protein
MSMPGIDNIRFSRHRPPPRRHHRRRCPGTMATASSMIVDGIGGAMPIRGAPRRHRGVRRCPAGVGDAN